MKKRMSIISFKKSLKLTTYCNKSRNVSIPKLPISSYEWKKY